jgi:hypothetical protein
MLRSVLAFIWSVAAAPCGPFYHPARGFQYAFDMTAFRVFQRARRIGFRSKGAAWIERSVQHFAGG